MLLSPITTHCVNSHGSFEWLAVKEWKYMDMEHMPWLGGRRDGAGDRVGVKGGCK